MSLHVHKLKTNNQQVRVCLFIACKCDLLIPSMRSYVWPFFLYVLAFVLRANCLHFYVFSFLVSDHFSCLHILLWIKSLISIWIHKSQCFFPSAVTLPSTPDLPSKINEHGISLAFVRANGSVNTLYVLSTLEWF